jgi:hypothetical protein
MAARRRLWTPRLVGAKKDIASAAGRAGGKRPTPNNEFYLGYQTKLWATTNASNADGVGLKQQGLVETPKAGQRIRVSSAWRANRDSVLDIAVNPVRFEVDQANPLAERGSKRSE